jgi:hypothetical protein
MFTDVQLPVRQGWGWGQVEARIPPAAPTPLTLLYTLLYICTVHELCSRTVGESLLRCHTQIEYKYITVRNALQSTEKKIVCL